MTRYNYLLFSRQFLEFGISNNLLASIFASAVQLFANHCYVQTVVLPGIA